MWAGLSENEAYGFSDVMRTNDIDDVIDDVTVGNVKHAPQTFKQNIVRFTFLGTCMSKKSMKAFIVFNY